MTVVQVEKLTTLIEKKTILQQIHFSAKQGEFIGLLGANGSGKSTLLRTIASFIKPTSGTVSILDRPITSYRPKALARIIGYVPQNTNVEFDFTAQHIVLMGRHPYHSSFSSETTDDYNIVQQVMEETNTLHLADRSVSSLSGGQRQMVFIAKALAQQPHILLLDEPISALDISYQLHVLQLIRKLADRGVTTIAALHDLDLTARFCDRILLLAHGKLVQEGTPATVLTPETLLSAYDVHANIDRNPWTNKVTVTAMSSCATTGDKQH